jgi:lipid A 3-O-deacylase
VSAELRLGWNRPGDFGTSRIRPGGDSAALFEERGRRLAGGNNFGFHFFAALGGRAVLRNMLLDGNSFRSSRRVDKYPFVGEAVAGLALTYKRLRFSCGYVFESRQFETQRKGQIYGTINLSFTLRD